MSSEVEGQDGESKGSLMTLNVSKFRCQWSSGADGVPVGPNRGVLTVDPFGGAEPRLLRRGKEAPLRVNPEQAQAFRPGCRRVDFLSSQAYKTPIMMPRER